VYVLLAFGVDRRRCAAVVEEQLKKSHVMEKRDTERECVCVLCVLVLHVVVLIGSGVPSLRMSTERSDVFQRKRERDKERVCAAGLRCYSGVLH